MVLCSVLWLMPLFRLMVGPPHPDGVGPIGSPIAGRWGTGLDGRIGVRGRIGSRSNAERRVCRGRRIVGRVGG